MAKFGDGKSNMKFWHITVLDGYKTVFQKRCMDIKEANTLFASKKEEYKDQGTNFTVMKELY